MGACCCCCCCSSGDPSPEIKERKPSAEGYQLEDRRLCLHLSYPPVSDCQEFQLTTVSGNESSQHGSLERPRSRQYYSRRLREKFSVAKDGTTPQLECIIIPSFGSCPPSTVAEKKATSHFLQGVGDDLKIIQHLIQEDGNKELIEVQLMCHFQQMKMATFTQKIKVQMSKLKFDRGTQKGRK